MSEKNYILSDEKPLILAIETSGRWGSVAIAEGGELLLEKEFSAPMRHSAEIFGAIEELLGRVGKVSGDIEQVYISVGPGSFTGIRIAVTIAKTMALANKCRIVAVDTLDVIAENVSNELGVERVGAILDAKRGQFFCAVYEWRNSMWEKVLDDCLLRPEEFGERVERPVGLVGEGLVYYRARFEGEQVSILDEKLWYPKAAAVHKLGWRKALRGEFSEAAGLVPKYIQRPDIRMKKV